MLSGGMAKKIAYIVLGMHRSGTSSVAGALARLGAERPLTEMEAAEDNPRGFFESRPIAELNDRVLEAGGSWWADWRRFDVKRLDPETLAGFRREIMETVLAEFGGAESLALKDPRICRLGGVWSGVLEEMGYRRVNIVPLRSPLEVAGSLHARNGMPIAKGLALWLRHVLDAERDTRKSGRVLMLWNDFMKDWRTAMAPVATLAGTGGFDMRRASEIDVYLSGDLRHQNVPDEDLASAPESHAWAAEAYACLTAAARGDGTASALKRLDQIRDRFESASDLFGRAGAAEATLTRQAESSGPGQFDHADYLRSLEGLKTLLESQRSATEAMRAERDTARAQAAQAAALEAERRRVYEERLRLSIQALAERG